MTFQLASADMVWSGAKQGVEGLTACCGVIGIAENVDVEFKRHRLNLGYLQCGKKMKENKYKPKSQFESRIIKSVKDSLRRKVKNIIAFHTIIIADYNAAVK